MDLLKKISKEAELLFKKFGIRSVTMSDIALKMGISKKTLYQNISNKNDLIQGMMLEHIEDTRSACIRIKKSSSHALEAFLQLSIYVQEQINDINPVLLYDLQKYHRDIWQMLNDFQRNEIQQLILDNINRGISEGLYRADVNAELISRIYTGFLPILSDLDLFPSETFPTAVLYKEFIKYHINGILSEKGKDIMSDWENNSTIFNPIQTK